MPTRKCPSTHILNPKTNRCVLKDGVLGKKILKRKSISKSKTKKKCSNKKVLNPKTNRCVSKKGVLGKKILRSKRKSHSKTSKPKRKFCKIQKNKYTLQQIPKYKNTFQDNVFDKILKHLSKFKSIIPQLNTLYPINELSFVGKGSYGVIFRHNNKILKISKITSVNEFNIHKQLDAISFAPKIFAYHKIGDISIILMEPINGFLEKYLEILRTKEEIHQIVVSIDEIIKTLCYHNILHGDFHIGNFALLEAPSMTYQSIGVLPVLIDFGFSRNTKCVPAFELIQMLRTLEPDYSKINRTNASNLRDGLLLLYQRYTGVSLPKRWSVYEKLWREMGSKYWN